MHTHIVKICDRAASRLASNALTSSTRIRVRLRGPAHEIRYTATTQFANIPITTPKTE